MFAKCKATVNVLSIFSRRIGFRSRLSFDSVCKSRGRRIGQQSLSIIRPITDVNVQQSIDIVKKELISSGLDSRHGHIYVGMGQYFDKIQRDRIIILYSEHGFIAHQPSKDSEAKPNILLDCSLETSEVDRLIDELGKFNNNIVHGEVNSVGKGDWTHGFILGNNFTIFSKSSLDFSCLKGKQLELFVNNTYKCISVDEIDSVKVALSEEPWDEQAIEVGHKDESITQVVGFSIENDKRDLAMLMVDTEWSVKAAALLCLKMKKSGHKIPLHLPRTLTVQGNPWVENRHDIWTRLSTSV